MQEALYWWEEASKLREQAKSIDDFAERAELLDLAETCEAIADNLQDQATGG